MVIVLSFPMSSSGVGLLVMHVADLLLLLSAQEVLGLVEGGNARVMAMVGGGAFPMLIFVPSFFVQFLFDFCDVVVV